MKKLLLILTILTACAARVPEGYFKAGASRVAERTPPFRDATCWSPTSVWMMGRTLRLAAPPMMQRALLTALLAVLVLGSQASALPNITAPVYDDYSSVHQGSA